MQKDFESPQQLGAWGEALVVDFLQCDGYDILAQNYHTRGGEIDIIALKGELLAFVEVKLRTKRYFNVSSVIVPSKQRKIISSARWYIAQHNPGPKSYRFDVALVEPHNRQQPLTYIPNAFTHQENYGW